MLYMLTTSVLLALLIVGVFDDRLYFGDDWEITASFHIHWFFYLIHAFFKKLRQVLVFFSPIEGTMLLYCLLRSLLLSRFWQTFFYEYDVIFRDIVLKSLLEKLLISFSLEPVS